MWAELGNIKLPKILLGLYNSIILLRFTEQSFLSFFLLLWGGFNWQDQNSLLGSKKEKILLCVLQLGCSWRTSPSLLWNPFIGFWAVKYGQKNKQTNKQREESLPHSWHLGLCWVCQVKSWAGNGFTTSLKMPASWDSPGSGKRRFCTLWCQYLTVNTLQLSRNFLGTQKYSMFCSFQVQALYSAVDSKQSWNNILCKFPCQVSGPTKQWLYFSTLGICVPCWHTKPGAPKARWDPEFRCLSLDNFAMSLHFLLQGFSALLEIKPEIIFGCKVSNELF